MQNWAKALQAAARRTLRLRPSRLHRPLVLASPQLLRLAALLCTSECATVREAAAQPAPPFTVCEPENETPGAAAAQVMALKVVAETSPQHPPRLITRLDRLLTCSSNAAQAWSSC